jgi:hypothetical protein
MATFGVHSQETDANQVRVTGRCFEGTIHVGDRFVSLTDIGGTVWPVSLEIGRITYFRRELPELDEGYTAELLLYGQGDDHLVHGTTLSTR